MRIIETTPPAAALAELKAFLRIESGQEDALLAGLLRAATETVEAMLGVLLIEREVEERGIIAAGRMKLTAEPARTLVEASRVDEAGEAVAVAGDRLRLQPGRHGGASLLVEGARDGEEIIVRYRAGTAANWNWVPEVLRLSVIRAAAHFHARRDAADDPGVPPAVRRMLAPWRSRRVL